MCGEYYGQESATGLSSIFFVFIAKRTLIYKHYEA